MEAGDIEWMSAGRGVWHTGSADAAIEFEAAADTRFVLGTAIPHPHELHLGYYSVHTSDVALREGEHEIERIGRELRAKGVLV